MTPQTVACPVPLSMGFSRQEYWSELLFPSPGDLPNPGIEPKSPTLQADSLPNEPQGSPNLNLLPLTSLSKGDAKVKNIYLSVSHAYFKVPSG